MRCLVCTASVTAVTGEKERGTEILCIFNAFFYEEIYGGKYSTYFKIEQFVVNYERTLLALTKQYPAPTSQTEAQTEYTHCMVNRVALANPQLGLSSSYSQYVT